MAVDQAAPIEPVAFMFEDGDMAYTPRAIALIADKRGLIPLYRHPPPMATPEAVEQALASLTDKQRLELFADYCTHCGSDNPFCPCMRDE
jgi:hypothetical protein